MLIVRSGALNFSIYSFINIHFFRVFDVKYPQKEYSFDFGRAIYDSVQEEQFKGMGFSKAIMSFDFGPVFENKGFLTIFAIDSDSEIYYASLSTLIMGIKYVTT